MTAQKNKNRTLNGRIKNDFFDGLFLLGVFLIPFDNVKFAPSSGWAAIAPLFFLAYIIFNYKYIFISNKFIKIFLLVLAISLLNYIVYPFYLPTLLDTAASLVLGVSFYISLDIYFRKKGRDVTVFLRVLIIAYAFSFLYGLLSVTNIASFNSIRAIFEKRHYARLQFTFTEPSFVSMHLFGVLLPVVIIFKQYKEVKHLLLLMFLFCVLNILFGESARFIVDLCAVGGIGIIYLLIKAKIKRTKKALIFLIGILFCILAWFVIKRIPRFERIIQRGVYSDASLASRWFRINGIIKGLFEKPINLFFGFGFGNTFYPFNLGYDAAVAEYTNEYMVEVLQLKNTVEASFFCGHLRIISDFGLIFYLAMLVSLYKKSSNKFLFWLMVYLYVQFDSFAFYAFWLFLFSCKPATQKRKEKSSVYKKELCVNTNSD